MSTQIQNSSKLNDESSDEVRGKMNASSWHQNSLSVSAAAQKTGLSSSGYTSGCNSSIPNADLIDSNDANKANYSAMTKKRKAMHQANSSHRNSADENINK
jgi:hypothetical protein